VGRYPEGKKTSLNQNFERKIQNILHPIASIPPSDRTSVVSFIVDLIKESINREHLPEILEGLFKDFEQGMEYFLIYLLPEHLRNVDILAAVHTNDGSLLNNTDCREAILKSCEEKLACLETLPPATSLAVAQFVQEHLEALQLHLNHPLFMEAVGIESILSAPEEKGPFGILKKVTALSIIPTAFQPESGQVAGIEVSFNMKALGALSEGVCLKRKDLPANATPDAWNELRFGFKEKVEADLEKAVEAIKELDPSSELSPKTIWDNILKIAFTDPERFLSGLLELTGPYPKQREAKWRAVLNNILNKGNEPRTESFFTEREEYFIKALGVIQGCSGGIAEGIDWAYDDLEKHLKYKIQLDAPKTAGQNLEEDRKELGIQYVKDILSPIEDNATLQEKIGALITAAKKNTKNSSEKLNDLLPKENYWTIDEDYNYTLNEIGAKELLKIISREKVKGPVLDFVAQTLNQHIQRQFARKNLMMFELTETPLYNDKGKKNDILELPHQKIYVRNVMGPVVGLGKELEFDKHSGTINGKLLVKSREEMLGIFFKYFTPTTTVEEFLRVVNEDVSNEEKERLKSFLQGDAFWEDDKLTHRGALELLISAGYLKT
jgi:hypothetical protein